MKQNLKLKLIIVFVIVNAFSIYSQPLLNPPTITSVSIDPFDNKFTINWDYPFADAIDGFVVYYRDIKDASNKRNVVIDTIHYPTIRTHSYFQNSGYIDADTFTVAAFKYWPLGTDSVITSIISEPHQSIYAEATYDSCQNYIKIQWTDYVGWGNDLELYEIHYTNGPMIDYAIDNELIEYLSPTSVIYKPQDITEDKDYCFYIRAKHVDGNTSSSSNETCTHVLKTMRPRWINADYATVEGENVVLRFTIDPVGEYTDFRLIRSSGRLENWDTVAVFQPVGNIIEYIDTAVSINKTNVYQLEALNNCGLPQQFSNNAGNFILIGGQSKNIVNISWNEYYGWENITDYSIYRITNGNEINMISTKRPDDRTFSEDLKQLADEGTQGEVCYYIEAHEGYNEHGIKGVSRSNKICIPATPIVYIPNAFTPDFDGKNDVFRPVLGFTPKSYNLQIFDRWGTMVFETNQPFEGWTGTQRNGNATEGTYIYHLKIEGYDSKVTVYTGNVLVLFP